MVIKRQTVLVVDDMPTNIKTLKELLSEDYEILFATSGQEAVEIATKNIPDIILLDVVMPNMDGYETCARIKADERTQNIPIIFITAKHEEEDERRGLAIGAIDYITKPFKAAIVEARIRNHLALKDFRDRLERISSIDSLTEISNRRNFDKCLDEEWRRAMRSSKPISLIMMDVDYFKQYNDHYGHQIGDKCLCKIASVLTECVGRPGDLVARFGGDEFVCLLTNSNMDGATHIANSIKEKVESLNLPHEASPAFSHITITCGVATITPNMKQPSGDLLKLADEMLYAAKQAGRNQVKGQQI